MLIQSKFKDYYDYLQGIWGVDEKLVYDRTNAFKTETSKDYQIVTLHVCGYKIQGMWMGGVVLYGEQLFPYLEKDYKTGLPKEQKAQSYYKRLYRNFDGLEHCWEIDIPIQVTGPRDWTTRYILKYPLLLEKSPNTELNCPIIFEQPLGAFHKNPILKSYNFQQCMSAEEIWIKLTEWLAKKHEEIIQDTRTNKEKILSNGFDLKTSFRK